MSLPPARYIVIQHDGAWKINLDNRYYGPFATRKIAVEMAIDTAQKADAAGYPSSALLMTGTAFEPLWTSPAKADTPKP
ncbi:DUF2188 domain-containing protein [Sphingobium algorifonticola]|uniref:DUF2188 domain-containing protein n=1 Tax=Sphingobium algorifonticola TaxID=2008318 RepID=A0A437J5S7_9SPHN|nr:DUF2188 domain-containing protein [Sphingobium algorifonticola]RVT40300.1 DUF2188 domain-containing protein [Sphingobium algorifonticola]